MHTFDHALSDMSLLLDNFFATAERSLGSLAMASPGSSKT
jgi:hypothetical protein